AIDSDDGLGRPSHGVAALMPMVRNARYLAAAFSVCVAVSSTWAQEALPPGRNEMRFRAQDRDSTAAQPRPLALEDLEQLALRYNPTLAQAAAAIDQERGVWRQVGLYPNPQV